MLLNLNVVTNRLRDELEVRRLQGYALDGLGETFERAQGDFTALLALHDQLKLLPLRSDWRYQESSDLPGIRAARPPAVPLPEFYLAEDEIRQNIYGAWLGRVAGCILGKPFEVGFTMEQIQSYLEGANALPLDDFMPAQSRSKERPLRRDCVPNMRGYVRYAQEDDLNYLCLAVKLLERTGVDFTTLEVGLNWLESIPFMWTWGPEHVVYLNLAATIGEHQAQAAAIDLEAVTSYFNPGVEWIGAQIRTDVYGYVCPGRPEKAAELA
jgi:hypothetical protein